MKWRFANMFFLTVAIVVSVFVSYGVYLSTMVSLELASAFMAQSSFSDAYLSANIYVPWPSLAVRVYGPLFRIQGFSWCDHSGQYAYSDKTQAIIYEERGSFALLAMEELTAEGRITAPLVGRKLNQGFSQTTATEGNVIRFYYGVSFTGKRAESDHTGPYDAELRYTFLGIPRVVRDSWHTW